MNIQPINNNLNSNGYSSILKSEWRAGNLPEVKIGLLGGELTEDTLSIEHIVPKSRHGVSCLRNYALSNKYNNHERGSKKLSEVTTPEIVKKHLMQFINVQTKRFNGLNYIRKVLPAIEAEGIHIDLEI